MEIYSMLFVIWCTSMTHWVLPVLWACTDYASSNINNPLTGWLCNQLLYLYRYHPSSATIYIAFNVRYLIFMDTTLVQISHSWVMQGILFSWTNFCHVLQRCTVAYFHGQTSVTCFRDVGSLFSWIVLWYLRNTMNRSKVAYF